MTRLFHAEDIAALLDPDLALAAMRTAFDAEARGETVLPKRTDTRTGTTILRIMPAVLGEVMGFKVMTIVEGVGNRYVVLILSVGTGELLAMLDADELTRQRTAATTALAALTMVTRAPMRVGMFGTGFEATTQMRAVARLWPEAQLTVWSPDPSHREAFASTMSAELGRAVLAASSATAAAAGQEVVLLATKSKQPVIEGGTIAKGSLVLSIGATRLDLRELDGATFARAGVVVGDDPAQLESESGDVAEAIRCGDLRRERIVSLAAVRADPELLKTDEAHDLRLFKSVGTALQDLALAHAILRRADEHGGGQVVGDIPRLKAPDRRGAKAPVAR